MDGTRPTVGLYGLNVGACADPRAAARIAAQAESLGFDSLWVGDHVVVPRPRVEPSPIEPDDPMLDPIVALGYLAAHTERIRLATGIVILPQRDPLVFAKQVASVDVLSGGRMTLGVGVGYLEPELAALGVPLSERGSRTDEYLAAMRSLWYDKEPAFQGRHVRFDGVDAYPRPVQQPLPVVVGGHSAAAHRRAAASGTGWYGWMLGLRAAAEQVAAVRTAGPDLEVTVSPARPVDAEVVRAYAGLGVDRLVVVPPLGLSGSELESFVDRHAPARIGARPAAW